MSHEYYYTYLVIKLMHCWKLVQINTMEVYSLLCLAIVSSVVVPGCLAQQASPIEVPLVDLGDSCPSPDALEQARSAHVASVKSTLQDADPEFARLSHEGPPCPCGGRGNWTRVAFLNMSENDQTQCPFSTWRLFVRSPGRGCSRSSLGCNSGFYPANGLVYSRVCGRISGYTHSTTGGFSHSVLGRRTVEDVYLDGVSLTHGPQGSRQLIWSFANAPHPALEPPAYYYCPCYPGYPYTLPDFIGNNYFCDTGRTLWDGEGCASTNTCCELNNPPWFCVTLPQPTTDDLEVRICNDGFSSHEDTIVTLIEIYAM